MLIENGANDMLRDVRDVRMIQLLSYVKKCYVGVRSLFYKS